MLRINGEKIDVKGSNKIFNDIVIKHNKIIINGSTIDLKKYADDLLVNIEISGDVIGNVITNGDVKIEGSCEDIDTNGNVEVKGNVNGDIDSNGDIICYGNIKGDIDTNGNVLLRRE